MAEHWLQQEQVTALKITGNMHKICIPVAM